MTKLDEIAPDVYRISVYVPEFQLQFNHFLVKDDEPLLFHTGLRSMFPAVLEAVAKVANPRGIRWVSFSHFESDECGALNHWLEAAPHAEPLCSLTGALVSVNDFAVRPARGLSHGEIVETGRHRFRFCSTAHIPHGWDAGLLFDETTKTLLCSDLFHHTGEVESLTRDDVAARSKQTMREMQASPLANYLPYTQQTGRVIEELAALEPRTLAIMHGSSFEGDGARAVRDLGAALHEVFGA